MCVIIYKPKETNMPTFKTLESCFNHNEHGAGYMLPLNGEVVIRKGFMTFKEFINDLNTFVLNNKIDLKATPLVMHFRISTQAGVKKELCHPYPLANTYAPMRELISESKFGVAHNGIISLTTNRHDLKNNDTMIFIKEYLTQLINNDLHYYKNDFKIKLIKALIGSNNKLAIMSSDGFVKLINHFYKDNDGCYYSNLNHKMVYNHYMNRFFDQELQY